MTDQNKQQPPSNSVNNLNLQATVENNKVIQNEQTPVDNNKDNQNQQTPEDNKKVNQNEQKSPLLEFIRKYVTVSLILGALLFLGIGVWFVLLSFNRKDQLPYYLLIEIGKAIILTVLVSIAINWFFRHQLSILDNAKQKAEKKDQEDKQQWFHKTVNEQLEELKREVLQQTQTIADKAVCIDGLQSADVECFFPTRDKANEGIKDALLQRGVTKIRLIGISLNDFMRDENKQLHQAWAGIRERIETNTPFAGAEKLDVKVLIINPRTTGAYLRAKAEGSRVVQSRLTGDVDNTIHDLVELEQANRELTCTERKVTFEAKIYHAYPIMFLAWTPNAAFVQPYYFRPSQSRSNIPTIKYYNSGKEGSIHQELGYHFDYIWENASQMVEDYSIMHCIGVDEAIREANITNIYYNYGESRARIINLINQAKDRLWIKGISLHAYFTYANSDLIEAIINAYSRGVDVRILLINPTSEQAKYRSFREFLMSHPNGRLEEFDDQARNGERLYTDTAISIGFIKTQLRNRLKNTDLNVRLYNSGPECFCLLNEFSALIEQYHYGKIVDPDRTGLILGGDMPVIEYAKQSGNFGHDRKKDPYQLFTDSFDYVYNYCSIGMDRF
jgi:hypothetical protein